MIIPLIRILLFLAFLIHTGCHEKAEDQIQLFPVSGKLLVDGQPAIGATIKFVPVNASEETLHSRTPAAAVGEDGNFKVSFFDLEDGAPEGTYKLLVFWMEIPTEGGLPKDRLNGQFCTEQSGAGQVTVKRGANILSTIELRTPPK